MAFVVVQFADTLMRHHWRTGEIKHTTPSASITDYGRRRKTDTDPLHAQCSSGTPSRAHMVCLFVMRNAPISELSGVIIMRFGLQLSLTMPTDQTKREFAFFPSCFFLGGGWGSEIFAFPAFFSFFSFFRRGLPSTHPDRTFAFFLGPYITIGTKQEKRFSSKTSFRSIIIFC